MSASSAERSARYRLKKAVIDAAKFNGWEVVPALLFVKDGVHRAVTFDNERITLVPEAATSVGSNGPATEHKTRKLYMPKGLDPLWFNKWRAAIIEQAPTKEATLTAIGTITSQDDKAVKLLHAMIEALPDTPDWYMHIPMGDES